MTPGFHWYIMESYSEISPGVLKMTESPRNIATFAIITSRVADLEKTIAKYNRKAIKINCAPLELIIGESFTEKFTQYNGYSQSTQYISKTNVTVIGSIPNIPGYIIAAVIDHNPIDIVHSYIEIPNHFRNRGSYCDHCNSMRNRNKTIILKNTDTNEFIQVGSTCLKDYLNRDVSQELGYLTWVDVIVKDYSDDYEYINSGRYIPEFSTIQVIANSIRMIESFGFVKTQDENLERGKWSTKSELMNYYFPNKYKASEIIENYNNKFKSGIEEATEKAQLVMDWIANNNSNSEFILNLKAMITRESVPSKYFGYIAGAVASYNREMDNSKTIIINNSYLPDNPGTKVTLKVKLDSIQSISSYYGTSYLHKWTDSENRRIAWFCSGKAMDNSLIGTEMTIMGTIKERKEFNNQKTTYLNRVKMV